ncbi:uncharacterized protein LOC119588913 [Penaeus monodon]|uniref:uncharacterized protein LOC119588913 n=1 Tax=Penaeus monodon TaxID=6687 RepID=UPI0018A7627E|nr:uncharacterized protein LOC119588913 [Penaeus monodon]
MIQRWTMTGFRLYKLLASFLLIFVHAQDSPGGVLRFQDLMPENPKDYDKMRPPKKDGQPTRVYFHVTVMGVDSVNENSMTYVADIFFAQSWEDHRLRLPDNMNSSYRLLEVEWLKDLWRPDSFFKNAKQVTFQTMTIPNHYVWLHKDSTILYMVKLTLTLSCAMNYAIYPHDTQECRLQMESLSHTTEDLVFDWEPDVPLEVGDNIELPQFDLVKNYTADCTQVYVTGNFTCLEVVFQLKRRLGYYLFHTYMPTCLIVIMSWVSFWIKPEAAPARVTLGVTSLLTLSTQHAKSQAALPPVSYIKIIDMFMSTCTVFVFLALMEYALVNVVLGDGPERPPKKGGTKCHKCYLIENGRLGVSNTAHSSLGRASRGRTSSHSRSIHDNGPGSQTPMYGTLAHGSPTHGGHARSSHATLEKSSLGRGTLDHMSLSRGTLDHISQERATLDHMSLSRGTLDHSSIGRGTLDHVNLSHGTLEHSSLGRGAMDHSSLSHGVMEHSSLGRGVMDHGNLSRGALERSSFSHGRLDHLTLGPGTLVHGSLSHGTLDHGGPCHGTLRHGSLSHGTLVHGSLGHGIHDHSNHCHGPLDHGSQFLDHGSQFHGTMDHGGQCHAALEEVSPCLGTLDHSSQCPAALEGTMEHDRLSHHERLSHGTLERGSLSHSTLDHGRLSHGSLDAATLMRGELEPSLSQVTLSHGTPSQRSSRHTYRSLSAPAHDHVARDSAAAVHDISTQCNYAYGDMLCPPLPSVPPPPPPPARMPGPTAAQKRRARAILVDRFSRVFFPSTFGLINAVYWIIFWLYL